MKTHFKKFGFIFLMICCLGNNVKGDTYDWIGKNSTDVTDPGNWAIIQTNPILPKCPDLPGDDDDIRIGVAPTYFPSTINTGGLGCLLAILPLPIPYTFSPVVTGSTIWKSVTFGHSVLSNTLTVDGSLIISGDITLAVNTNTSTNTTNGNNYLLGKGTLTCTNIQVSNGTNLSGNNNYLFSLINTLRVSNNVNILINTTANNGSGFRLEDGDMYITGQIKILNTYIASTSAGKANFGYFTINGVTSTGNATKKSPSLFLYNPNAIVLPTQTGVATVNFNGNRQSALAGGSVSVYYVSTGAQTIYTTSTTGFGSANFGTGIIDTSIPTYDNLYIQNTGTATIGASTTAGSLKIDSLFQTSSSTTFANSTITVVGGANTTAGTWRNSATITGGPGTTAVNGLLINNLPGIINQSSGDIVINGTTTNSGALNLGTGLTDIHGSITTSGILKMAGGALNISLNYNNTGTFTPSTGVATFDGITAQQLDDGSIAGTTFNNVNFSGASTKTINSGKFFVSSTGILTMVAPSSILAVGTNGNLTLNSNANGSASVAAIPSGTSITGSVNVQRFLSGGSISTNRGYRLLSSPVNQTQVTSSLTNTISLAYLNTHNYNGTTYLGAFTGGVGGSLNGFSGVSPNPTIYLYKEFLLVSNISFISGKHVGVVKINFTSPSTVNLSDGTTNNLGIPVGNGYIMFFVGPSTRTDGSAAILPADVILTANGFINQGNIKVNLWYIPKNGSANGASGNLSFSTLNTANAQGNNMVGNPYPSTIKLSTLFSHNTSIDNAYLLNKTSSPNQGYIAFTPNGSSSPSSDFVLSGQGFIVHTTGPNNSLTFLESDKAPTQQLTGPPLLMSTPYSKTVALNGASVKPIADLPSQTEQPLTGLYMKMEKDSIVYNYCGIYFREDWSPKFEVGDAQDLGGATVSMSSLSSDGIRAAVKHFPDYRKGVRVKLFVDAKTNGIYNLKMEGLRNIDTLYNIYLMDNKMKDSLDIRRHGLYHFNLDKSDTSSFGGNRFELVIRRQPLAPYSLTSFKGTKVPEGIQLSWVTRSEGNYTNFILQKQGSSASEFNSLYTKQGDDTSTYSFIDHNPVTGNNSYRLKQIDIDNNISFSQIISFDYNPNGSNGLFSVYPNPATQTISIMVSPDAAISSYTAYIYNSNGLLLSKKYTASNNWSQNVATFKPGIYIIELIDNNGKSVGKSKFLKAQ